MAVFDRIRVALAPVVGTESWSAACLASLHPAERRLISRHATPKRLAEFAAGRVAARRACGSLSGVATENAGSIDILPGSERGRPKAYRANDGQPLDVWLSITHADGLAAAAASHAPIGLDLISLVPLPRSFTDEAFAPDELPSWRKRFGADTPMAACAAFAAKEAVLKLMGTGMALPLPQVRVTLRDVDRNTSQTSTSLVLDLDVRVGPLANGVTLAREASGVFVTLGARLLVVVEWRGALAVHCSHAG